MSLDAAPATKLLNEPAAINPWSTRVFYIIRPIAMTMRNILTEHLFSLAFLILTAYIVIKSRVLFLKSVPFMVKHANIFRDAINVGITLIDGIIVVVKLIAALVEDLVMLASGGRHGHTIAVNFGKLRFVSTDEIRDTLQATAIAMSNSGSGSSAFAMIMQRATMDTICPIVRAMYPTKLKQPVLALLGWMVVANPDPIKQAHSCAPAPDSSAQLVALLFATGFILIEIGVPIILFTICTRRFWVQRYNTRVVTDVDGEQVLIE